MVRRLGGTLVGVAAAALALSAPASADTPVPEGGFGPVQVAKEPCEDKTYPECRRLRFTYGPIAVTPGNNAQFVGPVTIEKPAEDGYMTRFRPDLVRADGTAPPVDEIHLHHATWVNVLEGNSPPHPFIAAGEEKTIAEPRPPYGYLVRGTDTWQLNYMLHNATPRTETLWVVYDVDFTPRAAAERRGVIPTVPVWLDVMLDSDHPTYPVFNTQLGYGGLDRQGRRECAFPRETCAAFDPYGDPQPGNGRGWDRPVTAGIAGTIVGAAGHVHPGGLRTELSVVRGGRERRIFDSDAVYWDPNGPISWDMSMTTAKPGWKVHIRPGDRLRMNAVYETQRASWYEGMGIMMLWVAPSDRSGVDPFATQRVRERVRVKVRKRVKVRRRVTVRRRVLVRRTGATSRRVMAPRTGAATRRVSRTRRVWRTRWVWRKRWVWRMRWVTRPVPIETQGRVTHGHLPEASRYGGNSVRPIRAPDGQMTTDIGIGNFRYSAGDMSTLDRDGIPLVRHGGKLNFYNFDAAAGIWHTITTCKPPCTGVVGISYPLADDPSRLDSLELGYGPTMRSWFAQPTADRVDYSIEPAKVKLDPGTVATYYCRVHPFMRGAFKVVK